MAEIKKKIKNSKMITRITSIVLAIAVLVSAVVWFGDDNMESVQADVTQKEYFSYLVKRLQAGLQEQVNILEIVPFEGQGEFKYFTGSSEVIDGLTSNQAVLGEIYDGFGYGDDDRDVWQNVGDVYEAYGFQILKSSYDNSYKVRSTFPLADKITPEYADILSEAYNVYTVEANDLKLTDSTDADYQAKMDSGYIDLDTIDIIVISTGHHNDLTLDIYEAYSGKSANQFYDKNGVAGTLYTYDSYEMVAGAAGNPTYISRDAQWDMCEKLLNYMISGRQMQLTDGTIQTVKTPVILDNNGTDALDKTGNMYKLGLIYRMCDKTAWDNLKTHISPNDNAGVACINNGGLATVSLDGNMTWEAGNITDLSGNIGGTIYDTDPLAHDSYLTDSYWVYSGDELALPVDTVTETAMEAGTGFADRTGDMASVQGILQYLFGAEATQIVSFNLGRTLRVLEVQPCSSFDYDNLDAVKDLGKQLLIEGADTWTQDNYDDYIDVDMVSTNALNGLTDDTISVYDIIIIGQNYDILTKDNTTGKTIYNDRNLNGYIYLAFGDLTKISTAALGILPEDYVQVPDTTVGINGGTLQYQGSVDNNGSEIYRIDKGEIDDNHKAVRLNEDYRSYWTDYIYTSLHNNATDGKIFAVKSMYEYYKPNGTALQSLGANKYPNDGTLFLDFSLGNARYPENDITDNTKKKLLNYMQSGKALVLGDCLYDLDKTMVYPTSDIFDFAKTAATTVDGDRIYDVVRQDRVGASLIYMDSAVPEIEIYEKPVEPTYDAEGVINSFAEKQLTYKFDITGEAGSTYRVKLFIDRNNDGVYKDVDAGITDDTNELYVSEKVTLNANTISYTINSELSDKFIGMLSWKLEVVKLDESGNETVFSTSQTGYAAIRNYEPQTVYVLQIAPTDTGYVTLDLATNVKFQNYLQKIDELVGYNTIVQTVTATEYASWFEDDKYDRGVDYGTAADELSKKYDMVVIGYADAYGGDDISNENGAIDNILDYIEAGRSVLFTHDTMSYRANPSLMTAPADGSTAYSFGLGGTEINANGSKGDNNSGRQYASWGTFGFFNTITMRSLVGMDRYGVTLSAADRAGVEIPQYDEVAGKPSYETDNYINEIQGISLAMMMRANFIRNFQTEYQDKDYNLYVLAPFESIADGSANLFERTTRVEQINEGSVTQYPYNIPEDLTVTNTHCQYYELDMEDDDVVVWYTLAAPNNANANNYYNLTAKDAGNNYYIYSKGNVTYSGAGHQTMDSDAELKLFVNTIIRAMSGGNNAPVLVNTNGALGDGAAYYVYANSADPAANYEIDILGTDPDFLTLDAANGTIENVGRFMVAEVYWKDPRITEDIDGDGEPDNEVLVKSFDNVANPLRNGVQEKIILGQSNLNAEQLQYIEQLVEGVGETPGTQAEFRIFVSDWYGEKDEITVKLIERDLFNLN